MKLRLTGYDQIWLMCRKPHPLPPLLTAALRLVRGQERGKCPLFRGAPSPDGAVPVGRGGRGVRPKFAQLPWSGIGLVMAIVLTTMACATLAAPTATAIPTSTLPPTALPTQAPLPLATVTTAPTATATPVPATETPAPTAVVGVAPDHYRLHLIVDGLNEPLFLTHANDDSGRLFIVEQPGAIRIWRAGQLRQEPFLDIQDIVNDNANERGLLGLAFHPDYPINGLFFVNYTDANGDTVIARYRVSGDPDRADPASAQTLLVIDQPYTNHNGGHLAFGPDGYLYIGMGDGGSAGDPQNNGQNMNALLGKLLRIDVNQNPYGVPDDNPFVQQSGIRPEIWAYGLRNPWRFSFDRSTGDLFIADVGQNQIEEVNFQPAHSRGGENYGWRFMEGSSPYQGIAPEGLVLPVAEYTHFEGGCSVTGGYVYRGPALPALNGVYFFGDYCTGLIWSLHSTVSGAWERQLFMRSGLRISSFAEDQAGELYVIDHGGAAYQLTAGGGQ